MPEIMKESDRLEVIISDLGRQYDNMGRVINRGDGLCISIRCFSDKANSGDIAMLDEGINKRAWTSGYAGSITPLLGADGKPIITEYHDGINQL